MYEPSKERRTVPRLAACLQPIVTMLLFTILPVYAQADAVTVGVIVPDPDAEATSELTAAVARAAVQGAEMAEEEHAFNAEMFGLEFDVELRHASGPEEVTRTAQELLDDHQVLALAGGFLSADAEALAGWAAESGIPFLNVGVSHHGLRNERCEPTTFHIAPSAAMYIDALVGWYVRSAFREWFFVLGDGLEADALAERTLWSMRERHFGAREAGRADLPRDEDVAPVAREIERSGADLVLLLMDAEQQLQVLEALEEAGVAVPVAGFPAVEAQTRTFYDLSRRAAPTLGSDHRAAAWEASLEAYGAREFNARFRQAFGAPMEPSAWATYQAIKIVFEAATLGDASNPEDLTAYLTGPEAIFDVWKGIGVTFRPWDRQLRQSLYLVKINPDSDDPLRYADLVGELPAIYMPGTEPQERLDQLGDLQSRSRCDS